LNWYERRAFLLNAALTEPGWNCVKRIGERNIGRVVMQRKYGPWKGGFYPLTHPEFGAMERHYKAKHKKATQALPA
jgi:hypothetical protein